MPFNQQMHAELMNWLENNHNVLSEEVVHDVVHMSELSARDHQALIQNLIQVSALAPILKKYIASPLATLPKELIEEMGKHLIHRDIQQLAKTSMRMHSLFSDTFPKFLECVAFGDQNKAEHLLETVLHGRKDKIQEVLLHRGTFTDYSGRSFQCSAYEYAYWAKDTHMCRMLQRYMDEDTKAKMAMYIDRMMIDGLSYHQDGIQHQSPHFNFRPLFESLSGMALTLKTFIEATRNLPFDEMIQVSTTYEERGLFFASLFMKAQMNLPAHVIQEYCRPDRAFSPCPSFNEPDFPRSLVYSDSMNDNELVRWYPLPQIDLTNPFNPLMLFRVDYTSASDVVTNQKQPWVPCEADLVAITHLDAVRTEELKKLREGLDNTLSSSLISKK